MRDKGSLNYIILNKDKLKYNNMKANLLKLKRKHPFFFSLFYQDKLNAKRVKRLSRKLSEKAISLLKQKADECWGWDIDRDAYDACIIAAHAIQELANRISNEYI